MITSFADPSSPVIFVKKPTTEILYGGKTYSVAFSMSQHPRPAVIESISVRQMGVRKMERDVYSDPAVIQFLEGVSQTFELLSDSSDISVANFMMRISSPSGVSRKVTAGNLCMIRQPSSSMDSGHVFSMTTSTSDFSPVTYLTVDYWPTASLDLYLYPDLDIGATTSMSLPDMAGTTVVLFPALAKGIQDILASVRIRWYTDEARTILSSETPLVRGWPVFGMRIFASEPGVFSTGISGAGSVSAVSGGIWSTSSMEMLGYGPLSCNYWAKGSMTNDLWHNGINNIMISNGGLPIQDSMEKAFYLLPNPLVDVQFSSSSSSSSS